jgi:hypothetical protein
MAMRSEFSKLTQQALAGRAGYRCSIPGCDKITVGPGSRECEVACTGVAAHVFNAVPGGRGPRASSSLSREQIRSIGNAIWVCAEHARLIDANRGDKYPPTLLLSYKSLQEAKISREQRGIHATVGWFYQMIIDESPVFVPSAKVTFGKVTLVIGGNASGKTALCEWLAGVGNPEVLRRWRVPGRVQGGLKLRLAYFAPEERQVKLQVGPDGRVRHFLGDSEVPFHPYPLRVIMLRSIRDDMHRIPCDLELISELLKTDPCTVRNLLPSVNGGHGYVSNLRFEAEDGRFVLKADVKGTKAGLTFRALSGSEQARVMFEVAIAMARFSSQYTPTILMLDGGTWTLDEQWLSLYMQYLSRADHLFQTVLSLPTRHVTLSELGVGGWTIVRLEGKETGVRIDQILD